MTKEVAMRAPKTFDLDAHGAGWYSWEDISKCFWPGAGKKSVKVDPTLGQMVTSKGIYCIAWRAVGKAFPSNPAIQYIGQTSSFKARMNQFGWSAGFWGEQAPGHSAGWRWGEKKNDQMSVAFFPLPTSDIPRHMLNGYLHWYEALALDTYHQQNGSLPYVNIPKNGVVVLS
ncbi:hypothetical protein ACMSI6_15975 [Pseudomonas antarctica]|uniref:hypothetical protein n=1 Tax=Pseudomonas antarctica TaxID=219572 RepID=UPI001032B26C|nr:hypothetical protein [Pseudomonas antarctica]